MVWVKPLWYPLIYDRKSQVDGKLLMGYVLMDNQDYINFGKDIFKGQKNIKVQSSIEKLQIYKLGVRDLNVF